MRAIELSGAPAAGNVWSIRNGGSRCDSRGGSDLARTPGRAPGSGRNGLKREAGRCWLAAVDLFSRSWTALRSAVAELHDEDFARPSGCARWLMRDLVCHLIIDAQDVLSTLVTPADTGPTRDAVTYWDIVEPPTGDDPLDALVVRLAATCRRRSPVRRFPRRC